MEKQKLFQVVFIIILVGMVYWFMFMNGAMTPAKVWQNFEIMMYTSMILIFILVFALMSTPLGKWLGCRFSGDVLLDIVKNDGSIDMKRVKYKANANAVDGYGIFLPSIGGILNCMGVRRARVLATHPQYISPEYEIAAAKLWEKGFSSPTLDIAGTIIRIKKEQGVDLLDVPMKTVKQEDKDGKEEIITGAEDWLKGFGYSSIFIKMYQKYLPEIKEKELVEKMEKDSFVPVHSQIIEKFFMENSSPQQLDKILNTEKAEFLKKQNAGKNLDNKFIVTLLIVGTFLLLLAFMILSKTDLGSVFGGAAQAAKNVVPTNVAL